MKIGLFETLHRVHRLGRAMHPHLTLNSIKHQIKLLGIALIHFDVIQKWYEISDNPQLAQALSRFPLISGAMYWPYINITWPMERCLATIDQHYRMLGGTARIIARATMEEVELARVEEEFPGLRLVLDKTEWFLREGEIVLNLFVNDQRFYSIAFTLGNESGQPVIFVGALQGSNAEIAQDVYKNITQSLHGMRPRDFLMLSLKLLCKEIGVNKIYAVSSDKRQHNSPYFGTSHKDKVLVAYDDVWLEHGGMALDNGFYEIPVVIRYKEMSEIPTRKRATYRRRYQMLDKLAENIQSQFAQYAL